MPEELIQLIYLLGFSIIIASIFVIPVLLWRALKGQPLLDLKNREKFESPKIFYIGIFLFSGGALWAFHDKMPYHGMFLLIIVGLCLIGLIAYKKGWRG